MKFTTDNQKRIINNFGFFLILFYFSTPALSQENKNPFLEGTEIRVLTENQKLDLKKYVESTSARLREALDTAKGKGFEEAKAVYLNAIILIVLDSYKDQARSQLLARVALNQALQLTVGTPLANGAPSENQGVLEHMANPELLTVILEDSINLAINYCPNDLTAINALKIQDTNQLLDLPYDRLALSRLQLARKWLSSTLDTEASYALSVTAVSHWLSTMNRSDQLHLGKYAKELWDANKIIQNEMPSKALQQNIPIATLISKVRVLRGELRKLDESLSEKTTLQGLNQEITKKASSPFDRMSKITSGSGVDQALKKIKMLEAANAPITEIISVIEDFLKMASSLDPNRDYKGYYFLKQYRITNAEDFISLVTPFIDNPSVEYKDALEKLIDRHLDFFVKLKPTHSQFLYLKGKTGPVTSLMVLIKAELDLARDPSAVLKALMPGYEQISQAYKQSIRELARQYLDRFLELKPSENEIDQYTEIMRTGVARN
jgi:hypothetical protein